MCENSIDINFRDVDHEGPSAMGFLFEKVDENVISIIPGRCCSLAELCLQRCLDEAHTKDLKQQLLISTTIKRIFTILHEKSKALPSHFLQPVLNVVYLYWDHTTDVICHQSVDVFELLLTNHTLLCAECNNRLTCPLMLSIIDELFSSQSKCRSRFKCMLAALKTFNCSSQLSSSFFSSIYDVLENASLSVVVSDIVSHDLVCTPTNWPIHTSHILECLLSPSSNIRSAVKTRLLPILLKNPLLKRDFLDNLMSGLHMRPLSEEVLDANLSIARFLIFSQKKCDSYKLWSDYISFDTMTMCVLHSSSEVRIAAWTLLAEHPKRTQPFTKDDITLLKSFYLTNMAEQSPATRQKILAGLKKILFRLCETGELIIKGKIGDEHVLEEYSRFVRYLCDLSFDSLSVEANFSRRLLALYTIDFIFPQDYLRSNRKDLFVNQLALSNMLTGDRFKLLATCLDDSFQLCQSVALDLLTNLPFMDKFDYKTLRDETVTLMQSIRSHNTLASGYRFQLYVNRFPQEVQELLGQFIDMCFVNVEKARENLINITINTVHPVLNTISLLLEKSNYQSLASGNDTWWKKFVSDRLLPLCFDISELVSPIVHSMSPEGYIPVEMLSKMASTAVASTTQLQAETSQLLLACCWRAHKHVSNILSWMVTNLFPMGVLTTDDVCRIGEYYWLQMTECKHCGAFESAVEGFTDLCTFLWKTKSDHLPSPFIWLQHILSALEGQKDLNNLCSTRRSAGLPHLVTTILATQPPSSDNDAMKIALSSLLEMEHKTLVYKIHSLNVLKAVFLSSDLGDRISIGLEWACRVAVSGCSSSSWSLRNSSAQLAAALRARIFGVTRSSQRDLQVDPKNRQSSFEFFSRFLSLYRYLYDELTNMKDEFSVYPILIFLSHLFPTNSEKYPLAPFIPVCIKVLLWCKAEKLRRLAAATVVAISQDEDISFIISWLATIRFDGIQQNHVHATLLLVSSIVHSGRSGHFAHVEKFLQALIINSSMTWTHWCDYNVNLLLKTADELNISFNYSNFKGLSIDKLTLSKRPLALIYVDNGNIPETFMNDLQFRLQLYRWQQVLGRTIEKWLDVAKKQYTGIAIMDLDGHLQEREAHTILDVLYSNITLLDAPQRAQLALIISIHLTSRWQMPMTIAVARRMGMILSGWKMSSSDWEWFETAHDVEELEAKRCALDAGINSYRQEPSQRVLRILSHYLQDEDCDIRDEASRLISPIVSPSRLDVSLNPEVCYRLVLQQLPLEDVAAVDAIRAVDREGLFDACALNAYAEKITFGDFSPVNHLLKRVVKK